MSSSKKFFRTPSEILDYLDDCPSEGDYLFNDESDENDDDF